MSGRNSQPAYTSVYTAPAPVVKKTRPNGVSKIYTPAPESRDLNFGTIDDFSGVPVVSANISDVIEGLFKLYGNDNGEIFIRGDEMFAVIDLSSYKGRITLDVTGTMQDRGLMIIAPDPVRIILNNVSISSPCTPCLVVNGTERAYLELQGRNIFVDGRKYGTMYSDQEEGLWYFGSGFKGQISEHAEMVRDFAFGNAGSASLLCNGAGLVIEGTGSLDVMAEYGNAVQSSDYIKINGGFLSVLSMGLGGIFCENAFIMNGGEVSVNAIGNQKGFESNGIVVSGNPRYPGEGRISINGGKLSVSSTGKGLCSAGRGTSVENDEADNRPYPRVEFNGGTVNIKTTGTPYSSHSVSGLLMQDGRVSDTIVPDFSPNAVEAGIRIGMSGGDVKITSNARGLCVLNDAVSSIVLQGGNLDIVSVEDCFNARGDIFLEGCNVQAVATDGMVFNPNYYTAYITKGSLVGFGKNEPQDDMTCIQTTVFLGTEYLGAEGDRIMLTDSDGTVVLNEIIPGRNLTAVFSSEKLQTNHSYIYAKGSSENKETLTDVGQEISFDGNANAYGMPEFKIPEEDYITVSEEKPVTPVQTAPLSDEEQMRKMIEDLKNKASKE